MVPPTPPKAVGVEVIAAQATEPDRAVIAHLSARDGKTLAPVVYLVKLRFETMPPPGSSGWALYVDKHRIPKYWAHKDGIYFKVHDPQFFTDHKGQELRFSLNDTTFIDTGLKLELPVAEASKAAGEPSKLPLQADALK
jgi:hypothetical protein